MWIRARGWGQEMHLPAGKRFGIENWALPGQQRNSTISENASEWFLCLDNETFQAPCNWHLDIETSLENFVPVVIWLLFHDCLCVAYVRHRMAVAVGNTSTIGGLVKPSTSGTMNRERGGRNITLERRGVSPGHPSSYLYKVAVARYHESHFLITQWPHYLVRTSRFLFETIPCPVYSLKDLTASCLWPGQPVTASPWVWVLSRVTSWVPAAVQSSKQWVALGRACPFKSAA